jgi:uncharacterized protein YkwD
MKQLGVLLIIAYFAIALVACAQTPTPVAPAALASATPRPPQVKTEVIAPSPTAQVALTDTPAAEVSPTETPAVQPTQTPLTPEEPAPADTPPAPAGDDPQSAPCEDKAAFYDDVTIPDDSPFKQAVEFTKTWRIRNEGTCTWASYQLVWAGGSLLDAAIANPIPLTHPGDLVDISVKMRSPNQGGLYTSLWELQNTADKRFGVNSGGVDRIWTRISVTWYPDGSTAPGVSALPVPPGACVMQKNQAYIDQLIDLINTARQRNDLTALSLEVRLNAAAQAHSEDMACKNFSDHVGSDGSGWAERVRAAGYSYTYVSENIYTGDPEFGGDAQGAFNWWMNSPVHRDNILSPKVTQIGIGFASSPNAQFKGRYTLNFARP